MKTICLVDVPPAKQRRIRTMSMKKLFSVFLLCALFITLIPSATAEAPSAVYIAPYTRTDTEEGSGEPTSTVLYIYADGSYKQYVIENDELQISTGEDFDGDSESDTDPAEHGFVQVYPKPEEPESTTVPAPVMEPVFSEDGSTLSYLNEGTDTGIRITGYTKYKGMPDGYFLSPGDKIAVISPSALPGEEQTAATVAGLRSWGFEPVEGKHVYAEVRTLEECMEDLRWAIEDPEIKAIFCVRGGYGATEVIDAAEDLVASADKPIIGYSDITAYHAAWTMAGLPSIHACMSAAFDNLPEACIEAEQHIMAGEIPAYECQTNSLCREGTAEGILIGGNLSTFTATLDTAYDSTKLGKPYILFLEEVGENMQHIHRYLTILKHRDILDNAAGIVFGQWTELPADGQGNYGEARGGLFQSVAEMITRQLLKNFKVPVAFGFPAGHGDVNYPLLMGAEVKLDVNADSYTLSWACDAQS